MKRYLAKHPVLALFIFLCVLAFIMWRVNTPNFEYEKEHAFRFKLTGSVIYE